MSLVLAICSILAAFYMLAIVTEEFFVPAIDKLSKRLGLSSDAAGATLLAMGSSAPEFFASTIAVLGLAGGAHADIGAGTIVGSAIFNVLVILGAAALFKSVKLQWQPVLRDMVFYIITILLLLWVFWDGKVVLTEALMFVGVYIVYVFSVVHWRRLFDYQDVEVETDMADKTRNRLNKLAHSGLSLIIPDPNRRPKWYGLTFLMSILAIAGLSWVLVDRVVVIADVLSINPTFLALTVLAAGTSIPDLIGSVVVAKQGRGDMAVSNAVGSNIFDVLFGLGVPWLIAMTVAGQSAISVSRDNLLASILLLFATVVATLFLLIARRWRLGNRSGLVLIGLYVAYCVYIAISVAR